MTLRILNHNFGQNIYGVFTTQCLCRVLILYCCEFTLMTLFISFLLLRLSLQVFESINLSDNNCISIDFQNIKLNAIFVTNAVDYC